MRRNNLAILVTGLNDFDWTKLISESWNKKRIKTLLFRSDWKSNEDCQKKLKRLIDLIDKESKNNEISLIGISAGGSLSINAFSQRKSKINKIITVCSRVKRGKDFGINGFINKTKKSLSFRESVLNSEKNLNGFSLEEKKKILTIHAFFGDESVPKNTAVVNNAKNIGIPTCGHLFSIWSILVWGSKNIFEFVQEK